MSEEGKQTSQPDSVTSGHPAGSEGMEVMSTTARRLATATGHSLRCATLVQSHPCFVFSYTITDLL